VGKFILFYSLFFFPSSEPSAPSFPVIFLYQGNGKKMRRKERIGNSRSHISKKKKVSYPMFPCILGAHKYIYRGHE